MNCRTRESPVGTIVDIPIPALKSGSRRLRAGRTSTILSAMIMGGFANGCIILRKDVALFMLRGEYAFLAAKKYRDTNRQHRRYQ